MSHIFINLKEADYVLTRYLTEERPLNLREMESLHVLLNTVLSDLSQIIARMPADMKVSVLPMVSRLKLMSGV